MFGYQIIQLGYLVTYYLPLTIVTAYFLIILAAWLGWQKISVYNPGDLKEQVLVSIIIPFRNEEKNLSKIFADLARQTYPISLIEYIFIDDHSDIRLSELPILKTDTFKNSTLIELSEDKQGKKEALKAGAERSRGELLIFTDADCRLKPKWIDNIVFHYLQEKPAMIIGLVDYNNKPSIVNQFFRFDLMSLVVTGSGLAKIGFPVMCNGANLAVSRDIFFNSSKYSRPEIASGDDIFLLHNIKKDKSLKVIVMKAAESVVKTAGPENISEFINQRIRWASKSWSYTDKATIVLAMIVLLTNMIIIGALVHALLTGRFFGIVLLFLLKTIADYFIITAGLNFFGKLKYIYLFLLYSAIYPFYYLVIFFLSIAGTFSWKGRIFRGG